MSGFMDDRSESDDERSARDDRDDDREAREQISRDTTAAHTPGLDSVRTKGVPMKKNRSLLLVEDSRDVAMSLISALEGKGIDVRWAKTVAEARCMIAAPFPIDKAVFDMQLPDGNGTDLIDSEIPFEFPVAFYSGLPGTVEKKLREIGVEHPVFSKGDPFALLDWVEQR